MTSQRHNKTRDPRRRPVSKRSSTNQQMWYALNIPSVANDNGSDGRNNETNFHLLQRWRINKSETKPYTDEGDEATTTTTDTQNHNQDWIITNFHLLQRWRINKSETKPYTDEGDEATTTTTDTQNHNQDWIIARMTAKPWMCRLPFKAYGAVTTWKV